METTPAVGLLQAGGLTSRHQREAHAQRGHWLRHFASEMSGTFRGKKRKKERNRQKWEKTLHLNPHLRGFKVKLTKQANLQWSIYLCTGWSGATEVRKRRRERELNRVMEEEGKECEEDMKGERMNAESQTSFSKAVGVIRIDANKPRSSPKREIGITQPLWRNCGSAPEWEFLQKPEKPRNLSYQAWQPFWPSLRAPISISPSGGPWVTHPGYINIYMYKETRSSLSLRGPLKHCGIKSSWDIAKSQLAGFIKAAFQKKLEYLEKLLRHS